MIFLTVGCVHIAPKDSQLEVTSSKPPTSLDELGVWATLIGSWHGLQPTKDGGEKEWLTKYSFNGTYEIHFLIREKEKIISDTIEIGEWGIDGKVLFFLFKGYYENGEFFEVNSADPYNQDAYEILSLESDYMRYRSFSSGNFYEKRKVPSEFRL